MKVSAGTGGEFQIAGIIVRTDVDVLKDWTESHQTDFVGGETGLRT